MFKKWIVFFTFVLSISLVGCASGEKTGTTKATSNNQENVSNEENDMRTLTHLGKEYEVPKDAERIVIVGAMEAFEDALVLDVHLVGASTIAGEYPEVFADIAKDAEKIGEKTEPNLDIILQLKPDVILVSTKFPDETKEKLKKLAPMVEISHISSDGLENLKTLGEITGKQAEVNKAIEDYKQLLSETKEQLKEVKDLNILSLRLRGGEMYVYPDDVFLNYVIYHELEFPILDIAQQAPAQEAISLEKLSEVDPDVIFVQNAEFGSEEQLLTELEKNPIWNNLRAVKDGKVFINAIDPILEGGPVYSRGVLLEAIKEKLGE